MVHMVNGQWIYDCKNPCSTAKKVRTIYTYENIEITGKHSRDHTTAKADAFPVEIVCQLTVMIAFRMNFRTACAPPNLPFISIQAFSGC